MSDPWAALRTLRIGCVQYLNSRPLICAYDGPVVFDHPSALARMLGAGELDVALVPVFDVLSHVQDLRIVDGVAIACDGPVYSVVLAYRGELCDVKSVALDPASLTSVHLLKVLLAEFHGLHPQYGETGEAQLIIGNQAIEARQDGAGDSTLKFLDLGEEWKRQTGLPFVFAVWAMRKEVANAAAVADALRALKTAGVARIPEIVREEPLADAELRQRYLTKYIHFNIGDAERAALERYRELLMTHGFISSAEVPLQFI